MWYVLGLASQGILDRHPTRYMNHNGRYVRIGGPQGFAHLLQGPTQPKNNLPRLGYSASPPAAAAAAIDAAALLYDKTSPQWWHRARDVVTSSSPLPSRFHNFSFNTPLRSSNLHIHHPLFTTEYCA
ncbi:hypothetical protein Hamer_G021233 [Homarus americanus]|uniref:Uncharacterized protein n=1 Tax=Homarus americanus TaxID=6706 RepID=A0A8J5MPU4_HOMAM|nr:hypothetical protein Hamer_G021233 [Homarus americanus]